MLRNAPRPATNVVPKTGMAVTIGLPNGNAAPVSGSVAGSARKPAGWLSMPAKIVAKMTEIKVNAADAVPSFESMLKVRGKDDNQQITVMMAPKDTVWQETLEFGPTIVFRYLAPTRT